MHPSITALKMNADEDIMTLEDLMNDDFADLSIDTASLLKSTRRTRDLAEVIGIYATALQNLVDLKTHKDDEGKTEYYKKRQPEVWVEARNAITKADEILKEV